MWSPSEDGGAFAECFFAQYPLGMGKNPIPPSVVAAITGARENSVAPGKSSVSLVPTVAAGTLVVASPHGDDVSTSGNSEELEQTTEKTREALQQVLRCRKEQEEDFSGRNIRRAPRRKQMLEIALSGEMGATGMHDPAPIVRSPTRVKKGTDEEYESGGTAGLGPSSGTAVVPFSIGNWKNKRKLIIPLEQRLAQQAESHAAGSGSGISDHVMQLAVAMQQARKEVEAEQAAREKAQQDEEERRQAEREAEATRRARELLEKAAADMQQSSSHSRKETREERLERIRLERELREREKQQEVRQRRLARAAVRLGMTLEALEADEELLRTVDDAAAAAAIGGSGNVDRSARHTQHGVASSPAAVSGVRQDGAPAEHPPSLYADDTEEGVRPAGGIRKGVFGSAVISNEGIRREMEALAKLEGQREGVKDGIRLADEDGESSNDDDDGGLGMDQFMKKKRRL